MIATLHLLLATSWLDPIVNVMSQIVMAIDKPIQNLGWSLVILAALIRVFFWPLNTTQFRSMVKMQRVAPQIKKLQARYKEDAPKLQQETMALYKREGVNPLAGCWPMLVQWPFILSVYYVVMNHKNLFENQHWLWIGSSLSQAYPNVLATSLAHSDVVLLGPLCGVDVSERSLRKHAGHRPAASADAAHHVVHLAADARLLRLEVPLAVGDGAVLVLVQRLHDGADVLHAAQISRTALVCRHHARYHQMFRLRTTHWPRNCRALQQQRRFGRQDAKTGTNFGFQTFQKKE